MLPQLTWTILRIEKLFDQRSLRILLPDVARLLFERKQFLDEMRDRRNQRQPLDALRSPGGGDLVTWHSPHLLRVALEKSEVELAAEAIDEKVFQRVLGFAGKICAFK